MRQTKSRPANGRLARLLIALDLGLLVLAGGEARAQTSPHFRLEGGSLGSATGSSSAVKRVVVGEMGTGVTVARSSSESADVIGGSIGQGFSSVATAAIETDEAEYASVAFPLKPGDGAIASVLDELGAADLTRWRLGHWSPGDSTYLAADGDLTSVERGQGYFLITARPITIEHEGLSAPIGPYEIELKSGPEGRPAYNQLGNPFTFPIAVADLIVSDGTTQVPLIDPENTLTEAAAKVYRVDTDSYISNPTVIDAGTGFWVKKLVSGPVHLIVPYGAGRDAAEGPRVARPSRAQWAVAVTARQGQRSCEPLLVGAAPVPPGRWNSLCLSRAPDPPGGGLSLSIEEQDWGRMSGEFVRVFRPVAPTMSWEFSAHGAQWPGEVSLRFDLVDLPAGSRVWLSDPKDDWTREAANGQVISVVAKKDLRLRLTITPGAAPGPATPAVDGLRYVYPNPFRHRSGLVFSLVGGGAIEARIYDVSGRRIRTLSAPTSTSGERVLVWDGNDDGGRATAPGIYLAHYRAGRVAGVARLVKVE